MSKQKTWISSHIVILILICTVILSPLVANIRNVYATPRNLIPEEGENYTNQTNIKIPADLLSLLQNLEEAKKILMKYNSSLSNRIDEIEFLLLQGNTDEAISQYMKFINDLQDVLNEIKNFNAKDYERLLELLPKNLENYNLYSQNRAIDYTRIFQTKLNPQDLTFFKNLPNISMSKNFFNPETNPVPIPYPSIGITGNSILFIIFISSITIIGYLAYYYRNKTIAFLKKTKDKIRVNKIITRPKYTPSTSIEEIIYIYHLFLNNMEKLGFKKEDHESPLEFIDKIQDDILAKFGLQISLIFEKVKYGLKKPNNNEVELARETLIKLEGEIKE